MAEETPTASAGAPSPLKPNPMIHKPAAPTVALKPGLKLPPRPGTATAALKSGLRLPPKPVIHKPGAASSVAKPLPKPVTAAPTAAAPAAAPTVAAPEKPIEALKSVTQKLKGITQQIPQQAILRKTGIIADEAMSDAQKQAAKSKTARISLSDAMGVAPVKNENAPMKTIRIKRPTDIPGATSTKLSPVKPLAAAPTVNGDADANVPLDQRKTLKISRPTGGAVRPTGKFGIKRPTEDQPTAATIVGDIADIADIPGVPDMVTSSAPAQSDGPAWLWVLSSLVQLAACVAMGALAFFLYNNTVTQYF